MYKHVLYACTFVALTCCPALLALKLQTGGATERWVLAFGSWIVALLLLSTLWTRKE